MPVFEVQAEVDGVVHSHVAEYASAEDARKASEPHLGPNDRITDVLELGEGDRMYAATRRIAAAMCGQTADDGFELM